MNGLPRTKNPRQVILDFINKNPNCLVEEIMPAVPNYGRHTMCRALADMEAKGEVSRKQDRSMSGAPYRYVAIEFKASKPSCNYVSKASLYEEYAGDKFDKAYRVRQAILDYTNIYGHCTSKMLLDAGIVENYDHANRSCRKMETVGELQSHGKGTSLFFTALRTKTMCANEMRERALNNHQKGIDMDQEKRAKAKSRGSEPWRYVHIVKDDDKPIKNQDGIGSGRSRVYVGSSCGMI